MDMTVYLVIAAALLAIGSWLIFVWAAKSGQFKNVEEAKFRMLETERSMDKNTAAVSQPEQEEAGHERS